MMERKEIKKVVFVGGGHTNSLVIRDLQEIRKQVTEKFPCEFTLISKEEYSWYSGMLPGFLCGQYSIEEIRINLKQLCDIMNLKFVVSSVKIINKESNEIVLDDKTVIKYDILVLNIGSMTNQNFDITNSENVIFTRPLGELENKLKIFEQNVSNKSNLDIAIIGGGAAGVELAFSLNERFKALQKIVKIELFHSKNSFMEEKGASADSKARELLEEKLIKITKPVKIIEIKDDQIHFELKDDNKKMFAQFNLVIVATGAISFPLISQSKLATDNKGFMIVNNFLQSINIPNILGAGDCICIERFQNTLFPPKAGVYAVREAPIIKHNLIQLIMNEKTLKEYDPQKEALQLINTCDGQAILLKYGFAIRSRLFWKIKNKLDMDFINSFPRKKVLGLKSCQKK